MSARAGRLGVGIIGMGHVGPVIASALRAAGHSIVAVSASSDASRERADAMLPGVPIEEVPVVVERSEVVVLAVPDDQIRPLVKGLARSGAWQTGQIVIHLSGAHGVSVLDGAASQGAIPLAIHPAMTFTGTSVDVRRLVGAPFAVTGAAPFLPIAQALVVEMGGEPVVVDEERRPLYHAGLTHGANSIAGIANQTMRIRGRGGHLGARAPRRRGHSGRPRAGARRQRGPARGARHLRVDDPGAGRPAPGRAPARRAAGHGTAGCPAPVVKSRTRLAPAGRAG